jgi:amino acid transporter
MGLFSLAFGTIAGIAWLFLTGPWLRAAGPLGSIVGLLAGAALMIPIVWCYALASELYPGGGGELLYVGHTLGRSLGLLAGWLLALAYIALVAFHVVTVSWLAQVCLSRSAQMGAISAPPAALGTLLSLGIFATIVLGNIRGTSAASKLQDVIVALLVFATLALAVNAVRLGRTVNLKPYFGGADNVSSGIMQIIATAPFLYGGFNTSIQAVNDLNERKRGRVLLILCAAIVSAALFYCAILLSVAGILPREQLLSYEMPALDAFQAGIHSPAATLIAGIIALIALCTSWNGVFLGAWKLVIALSRARLVPLPSASGREPPIRAAVIFVTVISLLLSLRGRSGLLGIVAVVAVILAVVFCLVSAGILRVLMKRRVAGPQGGTGRVGIATLALVISLGVLWLSFKGLLQTPTSRSDAVLLVAGALAFVALAIGRRRQLLDLPPCQDS